MTLFSESTRADILKLNTTLTEMKTEIDRDNFEAITNITPLLKEAYTDDDPFLFSYIIYHAIDFAKHAVKKQQIDKIVFAFGMSSEATLMIVKMIEKGQAPLIAPMLMDRYIIQPNKSVDEELAAEKITEEKPSLSNFIPFSTDVYKHLSNNGIDCESILYDESLPETLFSELAIAIENRNLRDVAYNLLALSMLMTQLIATTKTEKLTNLLDSINTKVISLFQSNPDIQWLLLSLPPGIYEITSIDPITILDALKSSNTFLLREKQIPYIYKYAQKVGVPPSQIQEIKTFFRKNPTHQPDSDESLSKKLEDQSASPIDLRVIGSRFITHCHHAFEQNNTTLYAQYIQSLMETIKQMQQADNFHAVQTAFNLDTKTSSAIIFMLKHGLTGPLAMQLINKIININAYADDYLIPSEHLNKFNQSLHQALEKSPKTEFRNTQSITEDIQSLVSSETSPDISQEKTIQLELELSTLINIAYSSNNLDLFVEIIKQLEMCLRQQHQEGKSILPIFALLEKVKFDVKRIYDDLDQTYNNNALTRTLIDTCIAIQPEHRREQHTAENCSKKAFQAAAYNALALPNKTLGYMSFSNHGDRVSRSVVPYKFKSSSKEEHDKEIADLDKKSEGYNEQIKTFHGHKKGSVSLYDLKEQRRHLLYKALQSSDEQRFAKIIEQDITCLTSASQHESDDFINAMHLMDLSATQTYEFTKLIQEKKLAELRFQLLLLPNFSSSTHLHLLGLDSDSPSAHLSEKDGTQNSISLRSKTLEALDLEDIEGFPPSPKKMAQIVNKAIEKNALDQCGHVIKTLLSSMLYRLIRKKRGDINKIAKQIVALCKQTVSAYHQGKQSIACALLQTALINPLNPYQTREIIDIHALLAEKRINLLAWILINDWLLYKHTINNNLPQKDIVALTDSLVEATIQIRPPAPTITISSSDSEEECEPSLFESTTDTLTHLKNTIGSNNTIKIRVMALELQAKTRCQILTNQHEQLVKDWNKIFTNEPLTLTKQTRDKPKPDEIKGFASIMFYCLTLIAKHQERRKVCKAIKKHFDLRDKSTLYDLAVQHLTNNTTERENENKLTMLAGEVFLQLTVNYYLKEPDQFADMIEYTSKFIRTAYNKNDFTAILQTLPLETTDLILFVAILSSEDEQILRCYLTNYIIQQFRPPPSNETKTENEFKQKVFDKLGITAEDAFFSTNPKVLERQAKNNSELPDFSKIAMRLRTKVNNGVKVKKLESGVIMVAKIKEFHDILDTVKPDDTDTPDYHEFHQTLKAIWVCHLGGHLFSVTKPKVIFNGFHLTWEGSFSNVMPNHLKSFQKEVESNDTYQQALQQVNSRYFKHDPETTTMSLGSQISNEIQQSFIDTSTEPSSDKIMAIRIMLPGHLASVVLWDNLILIGNRGAYSEYNGIKVCEIGEMDQREAFIKSLSSPEKFDSTKPSFTSYDEFSTLLETLKPKPIYSLSMPKQTTGNCGMSSGAETMHLGTLFLFSLQKMRAQGRSMEDALSIAEEMARHLHQVVMQEARTQIVKELIAFFKDPACTLSPPRALFAHIYLISRYIDKNHAVIKLINQSGIINQCDLEAAHEDFICTYKRHLSESAQQPKDKQIDMSTLTWLSQIATDSYLMGNEEHHALVLSRAKRFMLIGGERSAAERKLAAEISADEIHKPMQPETLQQALASRTQDPQAFAQIKSILNAGIKQGLIEEVIWQPAANNRWHPVSTPNTRWFPVHLKLNASAETIMQFVLDHEKSGNALTCRSTR